MSRSKWKSYYVQPSLLKSFKKRKGLIRVWSRNSTILTNFIDKKVLIHNGIKFRMLKIKKEFIGFKFGDFSFTCKKHTTNKKKKKKLKKK